MAKQRRASSRPVRPKLDPAPPQAALREVTNPPRPGHLEAVALYEQGVAALQVHDYSRASSILRSVLSRYPAERDLHERVRLYLNICDRHMAPRATSPSTPEERVFAATLALNVGNFQEALGHLRTASEEAPDYDHALYMLASVLALCDEADAAVPVLLRAIELNSDNRAMARHDPDLEPLRRYDNVRAALDATHSTKADRRKTPRRR
jgi:tetratricopeptide (TPR) repeat protein